MTSKERAKLKSVAMVTESVLSLGKESLTEEFVRAAEEALEARELIKINVLKNCDDDLHAIAEALAQETGGEVVQVIGRKIVLYRMARKPENRNYYI